MKEVWKDIECYEGLYQVSNLGNVRSLDRIVKRKGQGDLPLKGKEVKQYLGKTGYDVVTLCKDCKLKQHKVHRLVAKSFIENPDNLPQVNHIDENKRNNKVDNLEWCSNFYNSNFGTRSKRISTNKKGIHAGGNADALKKKTVMCDLEGNEIKVFESVAEASKFLGKKDTGSIAYCCNGKRKTAYGFTWKYK